MYGDFSDSEKSNDLATNFKINALYLLVVVSCVPCVDLEPLQPVFIVVETSGGVSPPKEKRSLASPSTRRLQSSADKYNQSLQTSKIYPGISTANTKKVYPPLSLSRSVPPNNVKRNLAVFWLSAQGVHMSRTQIQHCFRRGVGGGTIFNHKAKWIS